jgi:hypothetical protein
MSYHQEPEDAGYTVDLPRQDLNESSIRHIAKKRGLPVYLSIRPCNYHGARVIRDLAGGCLDCLADGASNARARR